MTLALRPEAAADLAEAHKWYEGQRPGLGLEFIEEVDTALRRVARSPLQFPKVHGEVRRVLLRRFPFALYFIRNDRLSTVIAVLHQRRSPAASQRRGDS